MNIHRLFTILAILLLTLYPKTDFAKPETNLTNRTEAITAKQVISNTNDIPQSIENVLTNSVIEASVLNTKTNPLVIYYSWSGNTRTVAKTIAKEIGADIYEIRVTEPYPKKYIECAKIAATEISQKKLRTIKEDSVEYKDRNLIVIGSPVWWGTLPPPVVAFFKEKDLKGRTIAFFATYGGSCTDEFFSDLTKLIKGNPISMASWKSGECISSNTVLWARSLIR